MRDFHHLIALAVVFALAASFGSHLNTCRADGRRTDSGTAHLKIEGESILSLVLLDEHNEPITFVSSMKDYKVAFAPTTRAKPLNPADFITLPRGQILSLAPGRYRWSSVIVQEKDKGLKFSAHNRHGDCFVLNSGTTKILKIGAPLHQSLSVSRSGAILSVDYKLHGAGNEEYRPIIPSPSQRQSEAPKAPELLIYEADEKISSGYFRYG